MISNLGSTIAAEEGIDKALKRLDRHIEDLNKAGQELAINVNELETKCATLTQELQEVYAALGEQREE